MGATDDISAIETARKIRERKNLVDQTVGAATSSPPKKAKKRGARKKQAPSVGEIKKSKHTGSEGEPSYGQRMQDSPMAGGKTRFNQTGEGNGNSGNPY